MKKVLWAVVITLASLLLTSCEKSIIRDGRRLYEGYLRMQHQSSEVLAERYSVQGRMFVKWEVVYKEGEKQDTLRCTTTGDSLLQLEDYDNNGKHSYSADNLDIKTPNNMWVIIVIAVVLAIVFNIVFFKKEKADLVQEQKENEERKLIIEAYHAEIEALETTYGKPVAVIPVTHRLEDKYSISNHLYIYEQSKTVLVYGQPIPFDKILTYSLSDNQQVISTTSGTGETSTSTGSMVGRALVGGVLLGGVGALAGATTAKKDTEINTTTEHTTYHDYKIYLNLNDLANPQIVIRFGGDAESANKAACIFNIIIQNK